MKSLIILLTGLSVIIMSGVSLGTNEGILRLLMGNTEFDFIARIIVLAGMIALLVTSRPRSVALRVTFGLAAIVILAGVAVQFFSYQLQLFDAGIYMLAGIGLLIEALEPAPVSVPTVSTAKAV